MRTFFPWHSLASLSYAFADPACLEQYKYPKGVTRNELLLECSSISSIERPMNERMVGDGQWSRKHSVEREEVWDMGA
jgi:hypothetical protein